MDIWSSAAVETSQTLEPSLVDPALVLGSAEPVRLRTSPKTSEHGQHSQSMDTRDDANSWIESLEMHETQCLYWQATTALIQAMGEHGLNEEPSVEEFPVTPPISTFEMGTLSQTVSPSCQNGSVHSLPSSLPRGLISERSPKRHRQDIISSEDLAKVEKLGLNSAESKLVLGLLEGKTYLEVAPEVAKLEGFKITHSGLAMRMKKLRAKHPILQKLVPARKRSQASRRSPAKAQPLVKETIHVRTDD